MRVARAAGQTEAGALAVAGMSRRLALCGFVVALLFVCAAAAWADQDDPVAAELAKLTAAVEDMTKALNRVADALERERFGVVGWPPYKGLPVDVTSHKECSNGMWIPLTMDCAMWEVVFMNPHVKKCSNGTWIPRNLDCPWWGSAFPVLKDPVLKEFNPGIRR